ncbi:MAG: lamin tail domain-containing protein [Flavobacteriales bacterium]|nr:lamin tail domain-containing protein [Flavobacteriales bacterium]
MLKGLITILISLLSVCTVKYFTQVAEDFSDGDFTSNPTWSGDISLFTVTNGQLQSQSSGASTYYLSTPSTLASDAEWEFYFDFQFSTSGSNYGTFFLMSDNSDLSNVSNGYFVRMGTTTDDISFGKVVGGTVTILIDGADGLINSSTSNPFKVKVTRDLSDNWTLMYDDLGSSPTGGYVSGGSVNDGSVNSCTHLGMIITQSSAASVVNAHYFDDISVDNIAPDVTAPTVSLVTVTGANSLSVIFDEPVDVTTAQNSANYFVNNGILNPSSAVVNGGNPSQVDLSFSSSFTQVITYTLSVSNVQDPVGNTMTTSNHDFIYFVPVAAQAGDVIINEIFADPSPQIGLPSGEYIELYNRSANLFDLSGWIVSDGSSNAILPSYILMPGEIVAIADDDFSVEYSIYTNIIFVSSLPSLNNAGDLVRLTDNSSTVLDEVNYSDTWYRDAVKDDGGYSLELINPDLPCSGASNWTASDDVNGGTPGSENSVYDITPDTEAPSSISSNVLSNNSIEVCFSEPIDTIGISESNFSLSNGVDVTSISWDMDLACVSIITSTILDTGVIYTLVINGLVDCSGNTEIITETIILPSIPEKGDIIINEVLFNPFTGGSDFVEVYNNSQKIVDLFGISLANWDDGSIDNYKTIFQHRLIYPGDFVVITKDSSNVKINYLSSVTGSFVQLSSLPTYNDDSSTVYIILPDSVVSDQFSYDSDMHYPLIKDDNGVSLERIDYSRPSGDKTNWHSAAENVGWATPGRENSQYYPGVITEEMISTSPEIFSPDSDGYEDVLNIAYTLDAPGYVGNVTIFDREGRVVKYLLRSELLATEGIVTWDGTNNNREKAAIGVYLIYFEVFDLEGNVSSVKKSTVLAGKF